MTIVKSLGFKLVSAFMLTSLISIVMGAFFLQRFVTSQLDEIFVDAAQEKFVDNVIEYYVLYGTLDGVGQYVQGDNNRGNGNDRDNNNNNGNNRDENGSNNNNRDNNNDDERNGNDTNDAPPQNDNPPPPPNSGDGQPPRRDSMTETTTDLSQNKPPPPPREDDDPIRFVLVDDTRTVVIGFGDYKRNDVVSVNEVENGYDIVVEDVVIGTLIATEESDELLPSETLYVDRINTALLGAGGGALFAAFILGVLVTNYYTRPLREMTTAANEIRQGALYQHVSVRSQDELGILADAFNEMSAALDRANQLRRQMTADIAHDLRNPLLVLAGYLEALRDGVLQPTPERFSMMYDEAQQLQQLIEDLRTLSLADAGELSLERQSVPPCNLLESTKHAYAHKADEKGISLQVECAANLKSVNIDPDRMNRVLNNLVSNALRYTPQNGQITLAAEPAQQSVALLISDNGMGIEPEKLPNIFERFYRGDNARSEGVGETGLGLAIAKSIVEAHGGHIVVESELGRGTTFKILI